MSLLTDKLARCLSVPYDKAAYTVRDVVRMTGLSYMTVQRMFENAPGVIVLERPEKMNKRRYRSIRIPRAVYDRVIRKVTV